MSRRAATVSTLAVLWLALISDGFAGPGGGIGGGRGIGSGIGGGGFGSGGANNPVGSYGSGGYRSGRYGLGGSASGPRSPYNPPGSYDPARAVDPPGSYDRRTSVNPRGSAYNPGESGGAASPDLRRTSPPSVPHRFDTGGPYHNR